MAHLGTDHYMRGWNCAVFGINLTRFWSRDAREGYHDALEASVEDFVPFKTRNEDLVEEAYYGASSD